MCTCSALPVPGPEPDVRPAGLERTGVAAGRDLAIGLLAREPDLDVVRLARREAHVPSGQHHGAIRQLQALQHCLRVGDQRLELREGLLGRRELHELDLVELVLPDQSPDIGSIGSGLTAKAGRVGGVAQWQLPAIEDLGPIQIRERHFGGRDQKEIPVAGDLEQVLLELGQVAGAAQGVSVDQERRLDLDVAVLGRVQLQHEVDERPGQARTRAHQHRETRPGHPGRTLEIEDPECRAEVPVSLRLEREGRDRAPPPHFLVVVGRGPERDAGVRQVGQRHEQRVALAFDLIELDLELLDLLRALLIDGEDRRRILPLPLGFRDLLASGLLLALQTLDGRQEPPALCFELGEAVEIRRPFLPAALQAGPDDVQVIANESRVDHA